MSEAYLVVVRVLGDADRKRLEYLVERLTGEGLVSVRKLCTGVLVVEEQARGGFQRFLLDLYERFGVDSVEAWRLTALDVVAEPRVREGVLRVARAGDVWSVVDFVMAKYRGALVSELAGGRIRVYRVRGRYGAASVRFEFNDSMLRVVVEGYGSSVDRVFERLFSELSYLEKGSG